MGFPLRFGTENDELTLTFMHTSVNSIDNRRVSMIAVKNILYVISFLNMHVIEKQLLARARSNISLALTAFSSSLPRR